MTWRDVGAWAIVTVVIAGILVPAMLSVEYRIVVAFVGGIAVIAVVIVLTIRYVTDLVIWAFTHVYKHLQRWL